jgi:hypothetical protein
MEVNYIIPAGYMINRKGKRKIPRDLKEDDFNGLFYNGLRKEFARYYLICETDDSWFIERYIISADVIQIEQHKSCQGLWPEPHITKLEKIKNVKAASK